MATWVLNDETKANVYGFRVLNAGIDLERFKQNPVMLAMHKDWDLTSVIGRWTNIRVEGSLLLADDEFDMEDEEAARIAGKAERGFIKACSMGFLFVQEHLEKAVDGLFDLVQSELLETSLVTIPGNANAVRLYAAPGQLIEEKEIKLTLAAVMEELSISKTKNNSKMEKFTLSGAALSALLLSGLTAQDDPAAVNASIAKLGADLKKAQEDLSKANGTIQAMKDAQLAQLKTQANALVDGAIEAGKLTADQKDKFVQMAQSDFELASGIIASLPGKASLGVQVKGSPVGGNASDPKNLDEFQALPVHKQLAFKEENPEGYQALFAK